jgi:extradiol dioxygenase family protein
VEGLKVVRVMRPFHLAFPVDDLDAAEKFYRDVIGCSTGRRSDKWIDFDLWGHQVVAHLVDDASVVQRNEVDGDQVPAFHFGVVLGMDDWKALVARLEEHDAEFIVEPRVRFEGEPGEQATFFVKDPAGNALEFKAFKDLGQLFAT